MTFDLPKYTSSQAPPSPEAEEVNSDDEDYVQVPVTPVKGRKTLAKYESAYPAMLHYLFYNRKSIKSQETIEDSDVEEREAR